MTISEHVVSHSDADRTDQKLSRMASGLAAWLGGVAFCIGLGVSGPVWVAAVLTVLSTALVAGGALRAHRSR
jgi:hypothetical protein